MDIPNRLLLGRMVVGPDYYGCHNTGLAPAILHSIWLQRHPLSNRGFHYVVGPQVHLQDAARKLIAGDVPQDASFVEFGDGRRRVTFARTYKTALTRFAFLVDEITKANTAAQAQHQRLLAKAQRGDFQATLDLLDY